MDLEEDLYDDLIYTNTPSESDLDTEHEDTLLGNIYYLDDNSNIKTLSEPSTFPNPSNPNTSDPALTNNTNNRNNDSPDSKYSILSPFQKSLEQKTPNKNTANDPPSSPSPSTTSTSTPKPTIVSNSAIENQTESTPQSSITNRVLILDHSKESNAETIEPEKESALDDVLLYSHEIENSECHSIWRQYNLIPNSDNTSIKLSKYCYNCGSHTHFGDECDKYPPSWSYYKDNTAFSIKNVNANNSKIKRNLHSNDSKYSIQSKKPIRDEKYRTHISIKDTATRNNRVSDNHNNPNTKSFTTSNNNRNSSNLNQRNYNNQNSVQNGQSGQSGQNGQRNTFFNKVSKFRFNDSDSRPIRSFRHTTRHRQY
ncbi:hypothetical protein BB560_005933 [Smittium megazygosporum]|uniref:CCHC-type domain-containing protein n=1 Tax=Smittium megazygosporum TaxID=133381 RepID=A0A2T9YQ79_9FUNG|nr:hypothetical protein BB560_005933 [Smittium megazygosporum]